MASKRKFIIDTDPGTDDAQAIMMALVQDDIDVIALTTVFGNAKLEDTTRNCVRILDECSRLDVPIYKGCDKALCGSPSQGDGFHGFDGLGDLPDAHRVDLTCIKKEHAVMALLRLINEHKGEITLIALGPLTNVAMAIRLDPSLGEKLQGCYIMGGNTNGRGNITPTAEFNFYNDPIAADVVLAELGITSTVVDLQICKLFEFSWEWYEKFIQTPTKKAKFVCDIDKHMVGLIKSRGAKTYVSYDQLAVAVAINEKVALQTKEVHAYVENTGERTKGQMVIDWANRSNKKLNIRLLTKVDEHLFSDLMYQAVLR